jgi:hypothetical protein
LLIKSKQFKFHTRIRNVIFIGLRIAPVGSLSMAAFVEVKTFLGTFAFSSGERYLKVVNLDWPTRARAARVLAGFASRPSSQMKGTVVLLVLVPSPLISMRLTHGFAIEV